MIHVRYRTEDRRVLHKSEFAFSVSAGVGEADTTLESNVNSGKIQRLNVALDALEDDPTAVTADPNALLKTKIDDVVSDVTINPNLKALLSEWKNRL